MKIKSSLLAGVFILNNLGIAVADQSISTSDELQQLQLEYNNLLENKQASNSEYQKSKYTVQNDLPSSPGTPNYKFDISSRVGDFSIYFWRAKLESDEYVPLIRIEPSSDNGAFICSSEFTVLQNGKQFDEMKIHPGDNDSYCGTLLVGKTLIFDQRTFKDEDRFDDKGAFTVVLSVIGSLQRLRLDIPALSGAGNTPAPITKPAIVDGNLNIHMPTAFYGSLNIWADLEYKGIGSNNEHIWGLKGYGVNQ